jgi:signal peptidase II
VVLDQLTKAWAVRALDDDTVDLVWTLRLRLSFNTGAAFGLGRGLGPLLVAGAVLVLAALLAVGTRSVDTAAAAVALGLLVGGAVGNLADRLVGGHDGAVVDFIDLQWWPAFNVADAAITCGAVLLVVAQVRREPA